MRRLFLVASLALAGVVGVGSGGGGRCWDEWVAQAADDAAAPDEAVDAIAPGAAAIADDEADDVEADEADREAIADEKADDAKGDEADREAITDEEADDGEADEADAKAIADEEADGAPDVAEDAAPPAVGDTTAATKDGDDDPVVLESLTLTNHGPSQVELSFSEVPQKPTARNIEVPMVVRFRKDKVLIQLQETPKGIPIRAVR